MDGYSLLRHLQVGLQLHILPVCACVRVCVCVTGCPKKVAMVCLGDFRIGRGIGWGRLGTILMALEVIGTVRLYTTGPIH